MVRENVSITGAIEMVVFYQAATTAWSGALTECCGPSSRRKASPWRFGVDNGGDSDHSGHTPRRDVDVRAESGKIRPAAACMTGARFRGESAPL